MTTAILASGGLWATAAAVFWAIAVVLFKKAGDRASPLALNLFKNVVALVCFVPALFFAAGSPMPSWTPRDWLAVAISGILGIAIADTLFFAALRRLGAGLNAIIDCLYFPSLVVQAHLFLDQPITAGAVAGGALVIVGILLGAGGRPPPDRSRREIAEGAMIGAVGMLVVGSGLILIDDILHRSPVLWTTTMRLGAGTVALLPVILVRTERRELATLFRPSPWWRIAVPASVFGAALAMWAWLRGFALAGDYATVAILNQTSTIFIFLLAGVVLHEPITPRRGIAVILAFAGVVLVIAGT